MKVAPAETAENKTDPVPNQDIGNTDLISSDIQSAIGSGPAEVHQSGEVGADGHDNPALG